MGKSTSCFKIIACGNDSPDKDDLEASESKGSSDKRGWSFRKRSARHRVLSNTVITETPTSVHKESPESTALNFQPPVSTAVPEKISVKHCSDEKPRLLTPENPKVSEAEPKVPEAESKASETEPKILETGNAAEDESAVQCKLDESVAIVVQTAVRGSLAQRALVELKNVVKLQAVFRGYLVRKHAVGTLRCVQALVKVQAVVRARRARLSLEQEHEKDDHNSKTLEKKSLAAKSNIAYISIDQLLSNRFARQLLESTPRSKSIHLKCDSSKEDSSWKWMERWTAIASPGAAESNEPESLFEQQERQKEDTPYSLTESKIQDEVLFDIPESKSSMKESIVPSDSEENLISYDADNLNQLEQPQLDKTSSSDIKEISDEISSLRNESMQSDADSQKELKSFSGKPRMESEQPKRSMKRLASEELETEGKKSVFGSRKVSNPAFIAAQSKFEVLSSTTNSDRPISPSHQDFDSILLQRDTFQSGVDTDVRAKEPSVTENPVSNGSRVQVGGSECGTEISISSTLDSPDISDVGAMEHENEEAKVSEEGICSPKSSGNGDVGFQPISAPDVPDAVLNQLEKLDVVHLESVNSVVAMDSPQVESKPERTTSDLQMEQDTEAGTQAAYGSPETSPRSHIPESQGTPSSLISVKGKRSKDDQSGSNPRRKSLSAGKKSPSKTNPDSATSKDQKNGKRRNSFGSAKPPTDQGDQEPRDSSSNSSIPHFMQATESARAKLQATTSPRSSPDLQDRDLYIKKRHSLPGANGRQGSPRIQRSTSQEKQAAKANERKWNR